MLWLQVALGSAQEAQLKAEAALELLPHAVLLPQLLVQVCAASINK